MNSCFPFPAKTLEIFLGNYSTTKLFRDLWGTSDLISSFPREKNLNDISTAAGASNLSFASRHGIFHNNRFIPFGVKQLFMMSFHNIGGQYIHF